MKNWFLLAALVLSSVGSADPERVSTLSTKIVLEDTSGYFVLADKSLWKAIAFSKRSRSLSEWWNAIELAPKNFECLPDDWSLTAEIEVVPKKESQVNVANASNQDLLEKCTHLLFNKKTEQVLFAMALDPSECLTQLFKEASAEGYAKGLKKGEAKSNKMYNDGYTDGYRSGYQVGYQSGFRAGR